MKTSTIITSLVTLLLCTWAAYWLMNRKSTYTQLIEYGKNKQVQRALEIWVDENVSTNKMLGSHLKPAIAPPAYQRIELPFDWKKTGFRNSPRLVGLVEESGVNYGVWFLFENRCGILVLCVPPEQYYRQFPTTSPSFSSGRLQVYCGYDPE